jgi:hypothetical protein
MNETFKIIAIAFATAAALTIMGFQSWRRFPLLWGIVGIPTAIGYAAGDKGGYSRARRQILLTERDMDTLSAQLEALDNGGGRNVK